MWETTKTWFRNSLTIFWARVSMLVGALWAVLVQTDLSTILTNPKYMTIWMIVSGAITELARRRTL